MTYAKTKIYYICHMKKYNGREMKIDYQYRWEDQIGKKRQIMSLISQKSMDWNQKNEKDMQITKLCQRTDKPE